MKLCAEERRDMPKVFLVAAASLCGHITGFQPSPEDRTFLEVLRDRTSASLMGAGTLRKGNPEMRGTGGKLDDRRIRAFVSLSGDIPFQGKKIFQEGLPPLIFTSGDKVVSLHKRMKGRAEVLGLGLYENVLDLREAVAKLQERGAESILVEGGGGLNFHALNQKIIREIFLTLCPKIVKNSETERLLDTKEFCRGMENWDLVHAGSGAYSEVFLHYRAREHMNTPIQK